MEKKIVTIDPASVSIDLLMSELHMTEKHKHYGAIEKMYKEAIQIAKPVALYAGFVPEKYEGGISINQVKVEEPFVNEMLKDHELVFPFVTTCGEEIEEWSTSFTNMFEQYAADALKEIFLDAVTDAVRSEIKEKYFTAEKIISNINPGSLSEWPMQGQVPLFEMLGGKDSVKEHIGVVLKDSMIMVPVKSESGIAFASDTAYHNCQLCTAENCPSRAAPYSGTA
jgi:hypothetical protein